MRPMRLSILTAALQELTPRKRRDPHPDLAIEEWLALAQELGSPYIQLSAALHPASRTCARKPCSIPWRTRFRCPKWSRLPRAAACRRRSKGWVTGRMLRPECCAQHVRTSLLRWCRISPISFCRGHPRNRTVAHQNGYSVLLGDTQNSRIREKAYADLLETKQADGLITLLPHIPSLAMARPLPIVNACEGDFWI